MEFNEKLQELRKQKGFTQEELAQALYVSRTAISKWESGRGYPSIDSLKRIAKLFSVTVDELLAGDELLAIAEEDNKERESRLCDLVFGLLDISTLMFLFLPLFAERAGGTVREASLLELTGISPYLRIGYFAIVIVTSVFGVLTLALQSYSVVLWARIKSKISLILNVVGALLLILSLQPYAAAFLFTFLIIKALMLIKWQ